MLISPTVLKGIDWSTSKLQVSLTREAIKNSPHYRSELKGKNRGRGVAAGFEAVIRRRLGVRGGEQCTKG